MGVRGAIGARKGLTSLGFTAIPLVNSGEAKAFPFNNLFTISVTPKMFVVRFLHYFPGCYSPELAN